jgi:hypothetical protein
VGSLSSGQYAAEYTFYASFSLTRRQGDQVRLSERRRVSRSMPNQPQSAQLSLILSKTGATAQASITPGEACLQT